MSNKILISVIIIFIIGFSLFVFLRRPSKEVIPEIIEEDLLIDEGVEFAPLPIQEEVIKIEEETIEIQQ